MPCWRELKGLLRGHFPDLVSGYATLDEGIEFPILSSPDYALEFNLAVDSEDDPLTGIMFSRPGCGERWAYPLKFLCGLLDARIVDCGGGGGTFGTGTTCPTGSPKDFEEGER